MHKGPLTRFLASLETTLSRRGRGCRVFVASTVSSQPDGQHSKKPPPVLPDESSVPRKNICLSDIQNMIKRSHPARMRGETRRHDSWCGLRWTHFSPQGVRQARVRSSCVVLIPRRWDQAPGQKPGAMEANKPGTPGRARSSRNTIAQGVPVVSAHLY